MARRILNAAPIPPTKPDAAKRTNPAHDSTAGCITPAKFRNFYKIPHKNNREFDFTKQGFYQHTSGNNHTPPPPRYID